MTRLEKITAEISTELPRHFETVLVEIGEGASWVLEVLQQGYARGEFFAIDVCSIIIESAGVSVNCETDTPSTREVLDIVKQVCAKSGYPDPVYVVGQKISP